MGVTRASSAGIRLSSLPGLPLIVKPLKPPSLVSLMYLTLWAAIDSGTFGTVKACDDDRELDKPSWYLFYCSNLLT